MPNASSQPIGFASLLTGNTRGAVATIAVIGPLDSIAPHPPFTTPSPAPIAPGQVRYATWHGGRDDSPSESVVLSLISRPDNDPSSARWEIHCHGGKAASARILDDLTAAGFIIVPPDSWPADATLPDAYFPAATPSAASTIDAPGNDHPCDFPYDRLQQESEAILIRCESTLTAAIALDQSRSGLIAFIARAAQRLRDAIEPSSHASSNPTASGLDRVARSIREEAAQILARAEIGLHLTEPWKVVLAGPPNVGKSSLINSLVGYRRSITMDQPGTTRDVLEARTMLDGWPIRLSDTAGIRDNASSPIEAAGIEAARNELASADLVLWVEDASQPRHSDAHSPHRPVRDLQVRDRDVDRDPLPQLPRPTRSLRLLNKIDAASIGSDLLATNDPAHVIATSALTGEGIDQLRALIVKRLVPEPPEPGAAVPLNARQTRWLKRLASSANRDEMLTALQGLANED
jgi:tRNA modification GTPase